MHSQYIHLAIIIITLTALTVHAQNNYTCTNATATINSIQLGNCQNQFYILPLAIGTPPQYVNVVMDISSVLLIMQTNQSQSDYHPFQSSTLEVGREVVELELNNGQMFYGTVDQDMLTINQSNINIASEMILFDGQVITNYKETVGGLIGMGISNRYLNFLQVAYGFHQVASYAFTLSLNPNNATSYLYYNQIPSEISSNTTFLKSYSHDSYSIRILAIYIDGQEYQHHLPEKVIFSTINTYFSLPANIYNYVVSRYFASCNSTNAVLSCNCDQTNNWPTFTLMLAGAQIYLPPNSYLQITEDSTCSPAFQISDQKHYIVLGLPFFYTYNVTFDMNNKRIGLQGNLTTIQEVGEGFLLASQYVMLAGILGLCIFSGFLIWYLQVFKQYKPKIKFIQFGISDRFLESD